jgi:hypothetical protein
VILTQGQFDKLRYWQHEAVPGGILYVDSMDYSYPFAVVILFNRQGMSELAGILHNGELVRP